MAAVIDTLADGTKVVTVDNQGPTATFNSFAEVTNGLLALTGEVVGPYRLPRTLVNRIWTRLFGRGIDVCGGDAEGAKFSLRS